jgi:hypothetical protein
MIWVNMANLIAFTNKQLKVGFYFKRNKEMNYHFLYSMAVFVLE